MKPTKRSGKEGRAKVTVKNKTKAGARTAKPGKPATASTGKPRKREQDHWRELVETSAAWIWETDAAIRHTYTNAFVTRYLGYQPAEFLGWNTLDLVHPEDQGLMKKLVQNAIARKEGWFDQVLRWRHKDGHWKHIESSGMPMFNEQGTFTGLCGVDRDITEQKKVDEALRENEKRYRTLFESLDAAALLMRGAECVDCNAATLRLFGLSSRDEVIGKTPLDFAPARQPDGRDSAEFVRWNIEQALTKGLHVFEWQALKKSGEPVHLEVRLTSYRVGDEQYFQCFAIDITERKRVEESLRESEGRTRRIVESIPLGMHMYRLEPDGRLVFIGANPAADRILGVDNRIFIGMTIEEAFPPLKETDVPQRYRDVARSGKSWQTESIEYQDNAIKGAFEVNAFQTAPNAMVAAFEDVTARKRSELAVKQSEEKYRRLYNETPVLLHSIDRDARVVEVNDHWLKTLGYARNEVIGRKVTDFYSETSRKYAREVVQPAFFRDGVVKDVAYQFIKKNGEVVDVLLSASGERDAAGNVVSSQAVIVDISERKRIDEKLRESEERYRQLFDAESDAIFLIDNEAGRILMANAAAAALYGYSVEELFERKNTDLSVEPSETRKVTEETPVMKDNAVMIPLRYHRKKDGTVFPVEITGRFFTYQGRPVHIAAIRDITVRKRNEEQLKDSEAKYKFLIETTKTGYVILNGEGLVIDANAEYARMSGHDRLEDILGRSVTEWTAAHDQERNAKEVKKCLNTGLVRNLEIDYVQKDGTFTPIEINATVMRSGDTIQVFTICRDITDRKKVENEIAERGALLQQILDTSSVAIFLVDKAGRITRANKRMAEMFGYPMTELAGMEYVALVHPSERESGRAKMLALLASEIQSVDLERRYWHKKGTDFWGHLAGRRFYDVHGNELGLIGVISDITERKRAEDALRQSEKMLKTIIDAEPECVKLLDENANLIMMNRAGLDMLQVESLDQVKGQCVCPMVTSEYRQAFLDLTKRIFQGESGTLLFEIVGMKGRHLWLETHAVPLRNEKDEITALLGVTRDVSERKRAEEEARRNEARMTSLYRISQSSVEDEQAFLDLTLHEAIALTGSAIGYLYFYDEAKRQFTLNSYSRDVMKECSIADQKTCYELDRTGIWGEAVRQRKPILLNDFESDHPKKKGYPEGHARLLKFLTVPVIMQGSVVAVIGVANKPVDYTEADVLQLNLLMDSAWKMTQRGRAERALQESEERFRNLAESLPLTVFEMDLQGRFTYVNQAALEKFGYSQQEVDAGLNMIQMIAPDDRAKVREIMAQRLSGIAGGYQEYMGLRRDGTTFPITVASSTILQDGHSVGLRGIVIDLSERKQLEEELMKTQKLESIGTLAGGIAHDFNNLLQGIFGYISMAKLTISQREKSLAMLEQAEKALHQSVNLTSQLLTFSKGGKPVKRVVDLRPAIDNAVKFALSGSRLSYDLSFEAGLSAVNADQGQIGQVIQNIVLNAEQAMPEGGTISITARNVAAPGPGVPAGLPAGDYVSVAVQDSGVGIPVQYFTKIFDPYFSTKEKGSGLGLATSYSIVKNHQGMIDVSSEQGKGSTFTVYLPATGAPLDSRTAPVSPGCATGRTCRVLVMDDEKVVRDVAGELLRELGHEPAFAEHGDAALKQYRQAMSEGRPFDVVILDLTIRGGMGGLETLSKLREIDPGVKAVVSSGYSDDAEAAEYQAYGFRSYLKKPYNMELLQDVLNRLMA